ncbi:MAG: hypothetical protein H0T74_13965 [Rubrobacteraceae bacterium]|nr:hypothetical protein [Rubrobacteraceae bacterium]
MSNQEVMQQLADRFMNDTGFREQMRQDPEGAAEREGYQLDEEDRQSLRNRLKSLTSGPNASPSSASSPRR